MYWSSPRSGAGWPASVAGKSKSPAQARLPAIVPVVILEVPTAKDDRWSVFNVASEPGMSSVTLPSRRERNKRAVRARLVAATLKLAVAHGFDGTSVAEITAQAGVAKGTFFNYFPTKEAVIEERYD